MEVHTSSYLKTGNVGIPNFSANKLYLVSIPPIIEVAFFTPNNSFLILLFSSERFIKNSFNLFYLPDLIISLYVLQFSI